MKQKSRESVKPMNQRFIEALPFLFFALQFLLTFNYPPLESFDEFHYVPASKELVTLTSMRNWEHPPLAKYLMGTSWLVLHKGLGIVGEVQSMRLMAIVFGLLALWGFRAWMREFKFSPTLTTALVWTVGFNMAWFVQSKTAMLDIFALALGLWGLLLVKRQVRTEKLKQGLYGSLLLGLAMASKWSALPFVLVGAYYALRWPTRSLAQGVVALGGSYMLCFVPYLFLEQAPMSLMGFIDQQFRMLSGLKSTSEREHSYRSQWWQWVTLMRPMWYTFSKASENPASYYCVFMGGNPLLFWLGNGALVYLGVMSFLRKDLRRDGRTVLILALFFVPILIWILTPRKLMFFYYILPSSLWYGPALAAALVYVLKQNTTLTNRIAWTFVCLEGAFFFYMFPLLTGRPLSFSVFQTLYQSWMWRLNWI